MTGRLIKHVSVANWALKIRPHHSPRIVVLALCISRLLMLPEANLPADAPSGEAEVSIQVCDAVKIDSSKKVTLRGTGVRSREFGIVLLDATCPAGRSGGELVPSMIPLEIVSFSSKDLEDDFKASEQKWWVFQVLIRGDLTCQPNFKVDWKKDGDIVGNGHGAFGLSKCKLSKSELLFFHPIQSDAGTK